MGNIFSYAAGGGLLRGSVLGEKSEFFSEKRVSRA